jgi:hypothetical protein
MKTIIWQQSDVIVDREVESDEIVKTIEQNWDKKTVHYIWSETAIGKTSLITKVIEKYDNSDCDIIRIKTKPCNNDNSDTAWYYLQELFDGITKYFEKMEEENGYALTFDNFLNGYNDDSVNRTRLASSIETLFASDSKKGLFKNICYVALKRFFKLAEYSTEQFKYGTSVESVLVKANYIGYVLKKRKVLLIIDNFQNIDDQSLGCFRDWINDTDSNTYFILEFTHSSNSDKFDKQKKFFTESGAKVIKTELEPIDKTYITDIVHRNVKNLSNDIAFNINVVNHYEEVSLGNLRELIDYSVTYEQHNDTNESENIDIENGTYQVLHNINDYETLAVLSLIIYHKGKIKRKNAEMIFFPELNISNAIHELLGLNLIEETDDYYELKHASITDQWEKHIVEFEQINTVVYGRAKKYYLGYLESSNIFESNDAWTRLLYLYSKVEPFEIKSLLPQLESQIIISISPEDSWDYIKQLYDIIKEEVLKNKELLFRLLEICYKLELYANGYEILCFLEDSGHFPQSKLLTLHKLLYLSALDRHEDVVELFENIKPEIPLTSRIGLNMMLACLSSYRYTGQIAECLKIHKKILNTPVYKTYQEYSIFLRLTNIYLPNKKALKYAKQSVELLDEQNNIYQKGKSQITYAKLLAGLGKNDKALNILKQAEESLKNHAIRGNVLWVDEADILMDQGIYDNRVWDLLQKSEFTAVIPYDKIAIIIVKLAWCYENNEFARANSLIERGQNIIPLEPDHHIHALFYYNAYAVLNKSGETARSQIYYNKAYALKEHSRYIRARIDGPKTKEEKNRIKHPWYIIYLSFWNHDIENISE